MHLSWCQPILVLCSYCRSLKGYDERAAEIRTFVLKFWGSLNPNGHSSEKNLTPSRLRQGFRRRQGYGGQVVGQGRKGAKTDLKQKLAKEAKVRRVRAASHFLRDTTGWRSRVEAVLFCHGVFRLRVRV